jgi:2-hydroxycyclohexanecarboxyl-CoA dehydrogenase
MGEATCHELGRRGHRVAVLDLNGEMAQRVAEELRAGGVAAQGIGADVSHRAAVEEAFAKVRRELGPVHILVTSAGVVDFAPFTDISPQSWQRLIDVNLTGTFHCCQVAIPDMLEAGWGRIVMISSSSAQRGSPGMAHYAASKGALLSLTRSLAREYGPVGITVNNVPRRASKRRCSIGRRRLATCHPTSRWQPASRSDISAPVTTSRPRSVSCAQRRPPSSRVRRLVSTAGR